jgi:branched-chain amino acid transport system permease protein
MTLRKERIDRGIKVRSDDIFIVRSWREMIYFTAPRLLPIVLLFALVLITNEYWQRVLVQAAVFALLGMSWDLLANCGLISLGQALFFGVGAYISGSFNFYFGWSPLVTIPLATVLGGLLAALVLVPVFRLRGIYFSMVTLVLPLMMERIIEATAILGGTEGLTGLSSLPASWVELCIIFIPLWVCLFLLRRLIDSNYGVVIRAISDNDQSVINAGISLNLYKAQVVIIAGAIGAFCGAFMTHVYQFVGMPVFALDYSILPIASVIVGGAGNFAGAILGAYILVPLSELLRGIGGLRIVLYAIFLMVFVVALPEGIFHFLQRKYSQFERLVEVDK